MLDVVPNEMKLAVVLEGVEKKTSVGLTTFDKIGNIFKGIFHFPNLLLTLP